MSGRKVRGAPDFNERSAWLSQALRLRRLDRGLSQQEVASSAGLSIGTVRKIEANATRDPGIFTVLSLAATLGLDLEALVRLGLSPDEPSPDEPSPTTQAPTHQVSS